MYVYKRVDSRVIVGSRSGMVGGYKYRTYTKCIYLAHSPQIAPMLTTHFAQSQPITSKMCGKGASGFCS